MRLIRRGMLLALALVAAGCSRLPAAKPSAVEGCVRLYVFHATWCAQCRYIKPAALAVAKEYEGRAQVSIVGVESEEGRPLAQRYGIRCLPAALAIGAEGKPLGQVRCGFATYPALRAVMEEALAAAGCADGDGG